MAAHREGVVQVLELVEQDTHRPAIRNDVVHRQEEDVLGFMEAQDRARTSGPRSRSNLVDIGPSAAHRFAPAAPRRNIGQVDDAQTDGMDGATTCTGCPPISANVVRSDSWRRTISLRLASRALRSIPPWRCIEHGML